MLFCFIHRLVNTFCFMHVAWCYCTSVCMTTSMWCISMRLCVCDWVMLCGVFSCSRFVSNHKAYVTWHGFESWLNGTQCLGSFTPSYALSVFPPCFPLSLIIYCIPHSDKGCFEVPNTNLTLKFRFLDHEILKCKGFFQFNANQYSTVCLLFWHLGCWEQLRWKRELIFMHRMLLSKALWLFRWYLSSNQNWQPPGEALHLVAE